MKTYTYEYFGESYKVCVEKLKYPNGRMALQLHNETEEGAWEPFMTATANLPQSPCGENEVYIKDWNENEGIVEWLIKNKIINEKPKVGLEYTKPFNEKNKWNGAILTNLC